MYTKYISCYNNNSYFFLKLKFFWPKFHQSHITLLIFFSGKMISSSFRYLVTCQCSWLKFLWNVIKICFLFLLTCWPDTNYETFKTGLYKWSRQQFFLLSCPLPWCLFYTRPLHHHPHPNTHTRAIKTVIWCNKLLTYKHSWPITCSQLRVDCKTWHASGLLVMSFAIWYTVHILTVTVLTDNI